MPEPRPDKSQVTSGGARSIFREQARQHYLANQDRVVFPRLLSHKLFLILWLIAVVLLIVGMFITFWPLLQFGWGG